MAKAEFTVGSMHLQLLFLVVFANLNTALDIKQSCKEYFIKIGFATSVFVSIFV